MKTFMRGIYAIPSTPFHENLTVDEEGLRNCIRFCLDAGSQGIVLPVNASEFTYLSDEERKRVVEIAVETAEGRIPVVAGVSATCAPVAKIFAKHAQACGAAALIAMPPYVHKATFDEIFKYYQMLSETVDLPIFIQNYIPPVGTPMSPEFLMKLVEELDNVDYIKEETAFAGHVMSRVFDLARNLPDGKFKGVIGGKAGRYLIDEYRRGACGNMPACEIVDVQVKIWDYLEKGLEKEASEIYNQALPLMNFETAYGPAVYKEVLKRRGVIRSAAIRALDGRKLDALDLIELDRIMADLEPYFSVRTN